ncbi:MAG: Ferredoxin reductase [uncultured Solirubrobacteraceae bacterium]|uniref:Ferredoxin reductase n=1 Tax=uncultured Solirubrobacteraceae bacterium TaxID=1162706 RepID=A0A6J4TFK1_9ACTN|nr:MAG: Ferredoxin reductase [uncultured Solirubrobacteraceae bacterium]
MRIVIAGGGLAAQRCCAALRRLGHDGPITLVGDEPLLPYDRPPLSKDWLAGKVDEAALLLRPAGWYAEHDIEVRLRARAARLYAIARRLRLAGGEELRYDRLLIATGARARTLPGTERFENVGVLRSAADATVLRSTLRPGTRLVIVGAGFVGLEAAATARALGVDVTVIDAAATPLQAVVGPQLGAWFAAMHRDEGVDLRCSSGVDGFDAAGDVVRAVGLRDGTRIECDAVLVGIGVVPATEWLAGSPLEGSGVEVGDDGRSAIEDVFAAGDAARGAHWEAASRQGAAAAHSMLGLQAPAAGPASFWSDQYATRIQLLGDPRGATQLQIDGDPQSRDFTALYVRDGLVVAGLLAGRPRALPALRAQLGHPQRERNPA